MAARTALIWRLFPDVRTEERPRFLFFAGLITLISLAQTMGLAGSEALFLTKLGAGRLPPTFIAAALVTVVGSMVYAFRVGVVRNDGLYIQMLLGTGALLVVATVYVVAGSLWILPTLLCLWYVSDSVFVNHFWTFSGDYFDTLSSNRLVPYFTIGSSVGGALGGGAALLLNQFGGANALIAAWGVLLAGAALMLRLGRRRLHGWGPLELEEADETSVEGMRGALAHLRGSSLPRWLAVSALGMVFAFFLAQYLYSDIFARQFPDPKRLAAFLSLYFLVTNLLEILFEKLLTPWLIRRWGVSGANLIHPFLMLLSFGGLAFRYGFPAGVAARMGREMMDNAMAAPVRSLIYNAMPLRFRGKMRAFLEGIVVYAGMAVAGVVLMILADPDPRWLCAVGAAAATFYLFANLSVRRAYLDALVSQMREHSIDLSEVGDAMGGWVAARLADLWEQMLREEGRRPSQPLLDLIPILAKRGVVDPLVRAASHPNPEVRRDCIKALADTGAASVAGPLALALDDSEASVRRAALHGLAGIDPALLAARVTDLLDDSDPGVRAEAALQAGPRGLAILAEMIDATHGAEAIAALGVATSALLDKVVARARGDDPLVRAAALECAAEISDTPPLAADELFAALRDPDSGVRRAATRLVEKLEDEDAAPALATCLIDPSLEVRRAAERALTRIPGGATAAIEPYLHSDTERSVETALRVIATRNAPDARRLLHFELRRRVRELWYDVLVYEKLPRGQDLASRFLRAAYQDGMLRSRRLAFRILELLETPSLMRRIDRELRIGSKRSRANALNVLSNSGDRESARMLTALHEEGPLVERARSVAGIPQVPDSLPEILDAARHAESRWIRAGARACDPREGDEPSEEDAAMEPLLALKQVDLFKHMSLEQLDALLRVTSEVQYHPNEVIVKEGEHGDKLYLLVEGRVRYFRRHGEPDEVELVSDPPLNFFGEMAIFADEERTATVIADTPVRLLSLDGDSLKELILQRAEISFELFRVLTRRIRALERRREDARTPTAPAAE